MTRYDPTEIMTAEIQEVIEANRGLNAAGIAKAITIRLDLKVQTYQTPDPHDPYNQYGVVYSRIVGKRVR